MLEYSGWLGYMKKGELFHFRNACRSRTETVDRNAKISPCEGFFKDSNKYMFLVTTKSLPSRGYQYLQQLLTVLLIKLYCKMSSIESPEAVSLIVLNLVCRNTEIFPYIPICPRYLWLGCSMMNNSKYTANCTYIYIWDMYIRYSCIGSHMPLMKHWKSSNLWC